MEANSLDRINRQYTRKNAQLVEHWKMYTKNIQNKREKVILSQLLENELKFIAQNPAALNESTTTAAIASFDKYIFPTIRVVWPNLTAHELVSIQPMDGPNGMIFHMDILAGTGKGNIPLGGATASARTGFNENYYNLPSETVTSVAFPTDNGTTASITGAQLGPLPIRPGSVSVMWAGTGTPPARDNGNGTLVGGGVVAGTVNYTTGAISVTPSAGYTTGSVVATYVYNSEGSDSVPQLDLAISATNVQSEVWKIKSRWSAEAAALMKAQLGMDAEAELIEALAQHIRFAIDNTIINNLWLGRAAGDVIFDVNPPSAAVPYFTHQMSLLKTIHSGANKIFKATRRGYGNWIVAGVDAATIIESHPLFESAGNLNGPGVVFSGMFAGRWKVFKNPFLTNANGSGFGSTNFLIGYKGNNFFDTGYVYAPWIPFWRTPTVMLDDMVSRIGVMTHAANKLVNGLFYGGGTMSNA